MCFQGLSSVLCFGQHVEPNIAVTLYFVVQGCYKQVTRGVLVAMLYCEQFSSGAARCRNVKASQPDEPPKWFDLEALNEYARDT